ncbi:MAG: STAS domain-containing protein [Armatimonadetes bacterium]|nr:STAS domain-containing protein [Armatimonadota bacterium]
MLRTRLFQGGRTWFLGLQGAVDGEAEAHLQSLSIGGLPPDCRRLILDFRQVEYIDSQGVRWLLRLREVLATRCIDLRLVVRENSRVERALRLLAISNLFPIFRNPMDAWRHEAPAAAA